MKGIHIPDALMKTDDTTPVIRHWIASGIVALLCAMDCEKWALYRSKNGDFDDDKDDSEEDVEGRRGRRSSAGLAVWVIVGGAVLVLGLGFCRAGQL